MADLHRTDTPNSSVGAVKPSITEQAEAKTNATASQAALKANLTAAEAQQRANVTANQAAGKTSATVDHAENKLESFKSDLLDGKHRPHNHSDAPVHGSEQGAFLRTVGVPQQAGTAADAPGTGTASVGPTSSAAGVQGPTAPTGQGGVLAGTGAEATGPTGQHQSTSTETELSGTSKLAYNAADKAQQALENAKSKLFGGSST